MPKLRTPVDLAFSFLFSLRSVQLPHCWPFLSLRIICNKQSEFCYARIQKLMLPFKKIGQNRTSNLNGAREISFWLLFGQDYDSAIETSPDSKRWWFNFPMVFYFSRVSILAFLNSPKATSQTAAWLMANLAGYALFSVTCGTLVPLAPSRF